MNSVVALVIGFAVAAIGYYWYARYFDERVIQVDPKKATPAKMYMDGVDFIPTSRHVLFGYQFKSIAALGPVLGPIISLQWGWLPGLLWILLGTFFIGWIHDYSSAIICLRNDGETFGALSYKLISPRGRVILLSFMYFYLLLIVSAFGSIVASMLQGTPSVPLAILALMAVGLLSGYLIYKKKMDILAVTILMVVLSIFAIWLGTVIPIGGSYGAWVLFGLLFSFIGAVLPIWSYTQPINYISFYLVALGMLGAVLGIFVGHPNFSVPVFTTYSISVGPLWPILFVTIACGAISGWHSLVSSSGTARQLESETDTRYVTGGSMFLEMLLGLIALIIGAASFATFDEYGANLKALGPAGIFAAGLGALLNKLGIGAEFGKAFAGAMLVILAITIMQLAVRFMRIATAEIVGEGLPLLRNTYVGAFVAVLLTYILVMTGTWSYIWTLFGGANQLMAALALMLVSIWLAKEGKAWQFTYYPMLFMLVTTIAALVLTTRNLIITASRLSAGAANPPAGQSVGVAIGGNIISAAIAVFLIIAALVLAYDGLRMFGKARAGKLGKAPATAPAAKA
ncbi:MAG: carbon starvation protein A [Betaproteobacteria bacterium]